MKNIKLFKFENNEIRTILIKDEIWFVAKDVCDILEIKNTTDSIKRLDNDEVTRFNLGSLVGEVNVINESGLYSLIQTSRKQEAKKFKKWVTSELLPSIRIHGAYATNDFIEQALLDPSFAIRTFTAFKEERELRLKVERERIELNEVINEQKIKVNYYDIVLDASKLVSISDIAKKIGLTGRDLNRKLFELNIQYPIKDKQGKILR